MLGHIVQLRGSIQYLTLLEELRVPLFRKAFARWKVTDFPCPGKYKVHGNDRKQTRIIKVSSSTPNHSRRRSPHFILPVNTGFFRLRTRACPMILIRAVFELQRVARSLYLYILYFEDLPMACLMVSIVDISPPSMEKKLSQGKLAE